MDKFPKLAASLRLTWLVIWASALSLFPHAIALSDDSIGSDDATGRLLVWSDTVYLNAMNDIDARGDEVGYMVGDHGIAFRTRDRGDHWSKLPPFTDSRLTLVVGGQLGQVVVKSAEKYYVSFDWGDTWKKYNLNEGDEIKAVAIADDNPGVVWIVIASPGVGLGRPNGTVKLLATTDGGASWDTTDLNFVPDRLRPVGLNNGRALARTTIYRTGTAGRSWHRLPDLGLSLQEFVASMSTDGDALFVVTSIGRLAELRNDTIRWLPKIDADSIFRARLMPDGTGYAIDSSSKLYHTVDFRSGSWVAIETDGQKIRKAYGWPDGTFLTMTADDKVVVVDEARDVKTAFDVPGSPVLVSAAPHGKGVIATDKGTLLYTTTGGQVWTPSREDLSGSIRCVYANSSGTVAAVTGDNSAIISKDFGISWSSMPKLPLRRKDSWVSRCIVSPKSEVVVEIVEGDPPIQSWRMAYFDLSSNSWIDIARESSDIAMLLYRDNNELIAVLYDGTVIFSSDHGNSWLPLSEDIKRQLKEEFSSNEFFTIKSGYGLREKYAIVAGDKSIIFRTDDGGKSWRRLHLPDDNVDIRKVGILDGDNVFVYGFRTVNGQNGEYYATSSDGGEMWTPRETIGSGAFRMMSLAIDGTAITITDDGINYAEQILSGPMLNGKYDQTLAGNINYEISGKPEQAAAESIESISLFVRVDDDLTFREKHIKDYKISNVGTISFLWNPLDSPWIDTDYLQIRNGSRLSTKIAVAYKNGVVVTIRLTPFLYYPIFVQYGSEIRIVLIVISTVVVALLVLLAIYFAYPLLLISVYSLQQKILSGFEAFLPDVATFSVRYVILGGVVLRMAISERVMQRWLHSYQKGQASFAELPEDVFERYTERIEVIDAWVRRRFSAVRQHLLHEGEMLGASTYVPMPVDVVSNKQRESILRPQTKDMQPLLQGDRLAIQILGEGGTGKTSFAAELGRWAMAERPDDRLFDGAAVLAFILRGETQSILASIRSEHAKAFSDDDSLGDSDRILLKAMKFKRLILMFDGLTEVSSQTQNCVTEVFSTLPLKLLILTARKQFDDILDSSISMSPMQIGVGNLNYFVSQYIYELGRANTSSYREIDISRELLGLVEIRGAELQIPILFVVLFVDSIVNLGEAGFDRTPTSIPGIVQRYVRTLRPSRESSYDPDVFARYATLLAGLSLSNNFAPSEFDRDAAIRELQKSRNDTDFGQVLRSMLDVNLLISRVGPMGTAYSFRFDPVAEYLAATEAVWRCGSDIELWRRHLEEVFEKGDSIDSKGYIAALHETVVAVEKERGDLTLVIAELERRISVGKRYI